MILKWIGVVLIVLGCGSVGFLISANHHKEEKLLREFIRILDYSECELRYRLTPLPELFNQIASQFKGTLGAFFSGVSTEIESHIMSDMDACFSAVLDKIKSIPKITYQKLDLLGKSIGKFDLEGQLKGIHAVRNECKTALEQLEANRDQRLRSYQTLWLCAGAALAILLV